MFGQQPYFEHLFDLNMSSDFFFVFAAECLNIVDLHESAEAVLLVAMVVSA